MADTLDRLYEPIGAELDEVRAAVSELWRTTFQLVEGMSAAPSEPGGKMLRPAMCLLSAGAAGAGEPAKFIRLAMAAEALHIAALTHDDIVDRASLRRGHPSLNAMWDERVAVLSGDYIITRAMAVIAEYGSCPAIISTLDAVRRMTEGELTSFHRGIAYFTQEDCLRVADQKTASLFAATCALPTYFGADSLRQALCDYGAAFGIAFQLRDDLLDICQDEATLGKPTCCDLVEGKKTLPILFMRETLSGDGLERLDGMKGKPVGSEDRQWAADLLESSCARERTEAVSRTYVEKARAALAPLPEGACKDSMLGLAEFAFSRGS